MKEIAKAYDPSSTEEGIYKLWLDSGFFNPDRLPDAGSRDPYTIIMPPVNANGNLHVGHALFITIQDILIRFHRMRGRRALWLPGTDHAGFETQVVYEKRLEKEGRSRFNMTRDEFYSEVFEFVEQNKTNSEKGFELLGASCDWSRNIFTLDPKIIEVVYDTFEQLYKDGLVYRQGRICNWCPKHQTGLADLETKYEERTDTFYYLKYGPFVIGTARPETKFGDKYVVVHPDDPRYENFKHGQQFEAEWVNGKVTATVIKDTSIDMEFGTGAMTITPWHDAADFEIAQRHNLPYEQIIDFRGKLLPVAGEDFVGLKITEARTKIIERLREKGLVVEEKLDTNYKHNVQLCYKCNNLIEPQIVPQWYVAMRKELGAGKPSLRELALQAIDSGDVKIVTERYEKVFRHWMENIRDWPISRQIWWGIRIPVKYCGCGEIIVDTKGVIENCPKCGLGNLTQDSDTFDTWFSSGQWPFATMMANDLKHGSKDFETYFPTTVMETGWEIIFFWVARMVMLSLYRTGKAPFKDVYLHGLIRDASGQKMSKSKGNVVDPVEIKATYGADALRFALVFSTAAGTDIPLAEEKVKGMKHFGNKVWNIARYVLMNTEISHFRSEMVSGKSDADKHLLEKLEQTKTNLVQNIENYHFHLAAQELYDFIWKEFADVYVEASKAQLLDESSAENTRFILGYTLRETLKLLHPFMPFLTEEIWKNLEMDNLLIVEKI